MTPLLLALSGGIFGQTLQSPTATPVPGDDWLSRWLNHVSEIQSEQPHWVTPLITVTPRLEQEFRFDVNRQVQANGRHQWELGGGKGLEIIPFNRVEIIIGEPNYVSHNNPKVKDGFADETFLLKYRILSANAEHGDYVVSAFLGGSVPTASYTNGLTDASITPTIAAGKGFSNFSVQSTLGLQLPVENPAVIGKTVAWNTALQYHIKRLRLWPEMEFNQSYFIDGPSRGRTQTFVTPGLVIGRSPIHQRVGFTFGAGIKIATSTSHTYDHNLVLSMRLPF